MTFLCLRSFLVLLSTCRILHIHHNAAVFTEIEKKKKETAVCSSSLLYEKLNVKKRGNHNLMKDLSFIFLPVNSGLSSKKRGGRGRYQVRLLPALWFHLGALGSTYPHTSSLLSGPAASDLTV